jgi:hypothetical protein
VSTGNASRFNTSTEPAKDMQMDSVKLFMDIGGHSAATKRLPSAENRAGGSTSQRRYLDNICKRVSLGVAAQEEILSEHHLMHLLKH